MTTAEAYRDLSEAATILREEAERLRQLRSIILKLNGDSRYHTGLDMNFALSIFNIDGVVNTLSFFDVQGLNLPVMPSVGPAAPSLATH